MGYILSCALPSDKYTASSTPCCRLLPLLRVSLAFQLSLVFNHSEPRLRSKTLLPTRFIPGMDNYQQSLIAQFFSQCPRTSQAKCHQYIRQDLVPQLVPGRDTFVRVTPNLYQGSFSYTCVADLHNSTPNGKYIVIQFRHEKRDLWGTTEAHQLHGVIVPLVSFQGTHDGLFVYTSPLAPGIPYVGLLTACEISLSLDHRFKTVGDLADALTRKAQVPSDYLSFGTSLSSIESTVNTFHFQNKDLRRRISARISEIRDHDVGLAKLPLVLTHMDMTPFNYLVDMASGQVTAILDWDSAEYLPVGYNLHFVEHLFGYMTRDGWEDAEDREALEAFFYDRVWQRLLLQGFDEKDLEALDHEKTLGTLMFYVPKLLEWKDGMAERYLERYLQGRMTDLVSLPRE